MLPLRRRCIDVLTLIAGYANPLRSKILFLQSGVPALAPCSFLQTTFFKTSGSGPFAWPLSHRTLVASFLARWSKMFFNTFVIFSYVFTYDSCIVIFYVELLLFIIHFSVLCSLRGCTRRQSTTMIGSRSRSSRWNDRWDPRSTRAWFGASALPSDSYSRPTPAASPWRPGTSLSIAPSPIFPKGMHSPMTLGFNRSRRGCDHD